jgi:polysaccharide biosynthesis/export protein
MRKFVTLTATRSRIAVLSVITAAGLGVLALGGTVAHGRRVAPSATCGGAPDGAAHTAASVVGAQPITREVRRDPSVQACQWVAGGNQQASACWSARPPYDWPNAGDGVNTPYGQGSYVDPGRTPHVPEYRLRVDDILDVTFRRTRNEIAKPYELGVGDQIKVEMRGEPSISGQVEVQPDGTIILPLLGSVPAARRSVIQLGKELEEQYRKGKHFAAPAITVSPVQLNIRLQDLLNTVDRRYGQGGIAQEVRVTPDGTVSLPGVGTISAQGATLDELRHELNLRYAALVEGLDVQPILRARAPRFVFVLGEVRQPGRYTLEGPTTVMQSIALAGGITTSAAAKLHHIVVFRRGPDWRLMATLLNLHGPIVSGGINHREVDELWVADSDVVLVPKTGLLVLDEYLDLIFARGLYNVVPFSASVSFTKVSSL